MHSFTVGAAFGCAMSAAAAGATAPGRRSKVARCAYKQLARRSGGGVGGGGVETGYGHEGTTQSPVARLPGTTWRPDRVRA
jgi:hypothetical protein